MKRMIIPIKSRIRRSKLRCRKDPTFSCLKALNIFLLIGIFILIPECTIPISQALPPGLILHYKLADGSGLVATDFSGNNNHGTLMNGPTWAPEGNIILDGTDDYVISPDIKSLFVDETVTICLWFKANAAGVILDELGQNAINTSWHDSQIEILPTGEVKIRVWNTASLSLGQVDFGTWHHVTLRYDKSTQTLDGFLNGLEASQDVRGDRMAPWESGRGQYYSLGATDTTNLGSGSYFKGTIGDFRVYNRALTNSEVGDLASRPPSDPQPNQPPTASAAASSTLIEVGQQVQFTGSGTDSDGTIVSYNWDFGDDVTFNSQNTSHTYNNTGIYNVTLTVTDDDGATGTDSLTITVNEAPNEPPAADASGIPISGEAPLEVAFTGGGSDFDGSISGYSWDFGDGASSLSQNPIHTYDSPGTYTATLTVTDDDGATGAGSVNITVNEPPNQSPTASAGANPLTGEAPLEVQFTSTGSSDPDGNIVQYGWNFGDGTESIEQNPVHTYQEPGQYTVLLVVQDDDGAQDNDTVVITVEEPAQVDPPVTKEIPHLIRFQARLSDKNNTPLNGYYNVTFRIYDSETQGNLLWEKLYDNLEIANGAVNALLDIELPFDVPYWLSLEVNGETMNPRQPITSTAYSYRAEFAKKGGTATYTDRVEVSNAASSEFSIHLEEIPSSVKLYIWGEVSSAGDCPDNLSVKVDGVDITTNLLNLAWGGAESSLGDGTSNHPLITGTGEIDVTEFTTWSKGEHTLEFRQSGSTKAKIRYNVYISY